MTGTRPLDAEFKRRLEAHVQRFYHSSGEGELLEATGLDLSQLDLSGLRLRGVTFVRCDLRDASLQNVRLDATKLDRCLVAGASLIGAYGTVIRAPIDVGSPEEPQPLAADDALRWLRAAGAEV